MAKSVSETRVRAAREWAGAIANRRFYEEKLAADTAPELLESDAFALARAEKAEQEAREKYVGTLGSTGGNRTAVRLAKT